jgi:hypothetical protein
VRSKNLAKERRNGDEATASRGLRLFDVTKVPAHFFQRSSDSNLSLQKIQTVPPKAGKFTPSRAEICARVDEGGLDC